MCSEWHYTTREIGGWRHDNEPVGRVVMSPYANPTDCKDAIGEQWSQRTFNYMEALKGHVKFFKTVCVSPN